MLHRIQVPNVSFGPVVDPGAHLLFYAGGDARIHAVDTRTYRERLTIPDSHSTELFSQIPSGGAPFLDLKAGRLIAVTSDAVDIVGPNPVSVATDRARRRLFVVTQAQGANGLVESGTLTMLDERSAAVERTVAVGVNPTVAVYDACSDRLLVFDAGGGVAASDPWSALPDWLRSRLPFASSSSHRRAYFRRGAAVVD